MAAAYRARTRLRREPVLSAVEGLSRALAGVLVMIGYTVGLGFVLGYAVLKSGSVLLAAFLHALNNQVVGFLSMMVYRPTDPIFSFGVGLYGIAVLAVIVLLVLRGPIWQQR